MTRAGLRVRLFVLRIGRRRRVRIGNERALIRLLSLARGDGRPS